MEGVAKLAEKVNKVYLYYCNLSAPIRASLFVTLITVLQKGIWFISTPIYTRLLTTNEYGLYSLFTSWVSIMSVIATLNLSGGGFNNGLLKYKEDKYGYVSSLQGLGNVVTVLVFFLLFFTRSFFMKISGLDARMMIALFIFLMMTPAFEIWAQFQRFEYRYKELGISTVLMAILTVVASLVLIFLLQEKKYAPIYGMVGIQSIFGIVYYIKNILKGKKLYNYKYWQFIWKFNVPLVPHYLATIILGQADRIMIEYYCGSDKVGIYSLSYSVSLMFTIITNAVSAGYAPWAYREYEMREYRGIREYARKMIILCGIIMIILTLFAPELVRFLGGEEYMEAIWVIPSVMLGGYYMLVYGFFSSFEFFYEKNVLIMMGSVLAAIINILLNYLCIPVFGYIAAGYTTLISYVFMTVFHFGGMKWTCKQNKTGRIYDNMFIFKFSGAVTLIGLLVLYIYNMPLIRYIIIAGIFMMVIFFRKKIIGILCDLKSKEL